MHYAVTCSECGVGMKWQATRCPRCDAVAPTKPPLPFVLDDLSLDTQPMELTRAWLCVIGSTAAMEVDRPLVIGRGSSADVRFPGSTISRRHALILGERASFKLFDLNSRNGVFLNEQRVTDAALADGDLIRVGSVVLSFSFQEPSRV